MIDQGSKHDEAKRVGKFPDILQCHHFVNKTVHDNLK